MISKKNAIIFYDLQDTQITLKKLSENSKNRD